MRRKILVTNSPQLEHGISVIRAHLQRLTKRDISTAEAIRVAVTMTAQAIEKNKKESDSE